MAASYSFFPSTDAALLGWATNFSTRLSAAPTTFNVTAAQCTAFATLVTAYSTALAGCEKSVRSKASVVTKNEARDAMKASAKLLANCVYGSATVTDAQKLQLGLNVRATPTPIPAPTAAPKLTIAEQHGWTFKLALRDAEPLSRKAKPTGVQGANVFSFVGPTPPTDIAAWKFEGGTTKNIVDCVVDSSLAPGTLVWFTAFWFNPRMQSGPACPPISAYVQFGAIAKAA
jgi:hypothetical protein